MSRRAFVFVALMTAVCLAGPPAAALQTPAPAAAPSVAEFDVNGLKVLVKQRPGSATVAAGLFILGGARNITADNAGIEALMLAVATEASTAFPRDKFRRELSRTGTVISSGVNLDYGAFTLACTRRYFDQAWAQFTDAAMHPSFSTDDFERVKNLTLVAMNTDEDTPDSHLESLMSKVIYADHPYANDPHGTKESVSKLTVADMKSFHTRVMLTTHLLLVIVGDVDPAQVRRLVEGSLGKLPRGNYSPKPMPALSFPAPTAAVTAKALPTNYIQGVYAAPSLSSPDIYAMRVANSILQQRIFEEVRLRRALSYAPDAFLGSQTANVGGIYVTAVEATTAVRVMLGEIEKLKSNDVDRSDIGASAGMFLTSHYVSEQTNGAQAGTLAQAQIVAGDWRTAGEVLNKLRAVTPADIKRVARLYIKNLQFVVLGNPQQIDQSVLLKQGGGMPLLVPPGPAARPFGPPILR